MIAASAPQLRFALASAHYSPDTPATRITAGDLHSYATASALAWHEANDSRQIPQSRLRDELTAIAHLVREKAAAAGIPAPPHPLPISLPAPSNRLDHVMHRDGMAPLDALQWGMDTVCEQGLEELTDTEVLGLCCVSAALHCCVLNLHEQRALVRGLDTPVHATGQWWHLDLQLTSGREERLELRRVFLHPYPAAIRIACVTRLNASKTRSPESLNAQDDTRLNRLMNASVRAFARRVGLSQSDAPKTLGRVMEWQAARMRVLQTPLIEAYATRSIISHSVPLNVFRRWHGLAPIHARNNHSVDKREAAEKYTNATSRSPGLTGAIQRQLDDVRRIFRAHGDVKNRQKALGALEESPSFGLPQALRCLIDFGQAVARGQVRGCKKQKGVSISSMLYKLGPAWLAGTAGLDLNTLNQGDIESICLDILEQNETPHQRARIARPLRQFLEYLEDAGYLTGLDLPEIPRALGLLAVSANVATPRESAFAAEVMRDASAFASLAEREAATTMVQVAASCGLRRNEILHVLAGDLHENPDGSLTLIVRPNANRDLKSTGSQRLAPLGLAPREAQDRLKRYCRNAAPDAPVISAALGATHATYEWRFFPLMNKALKQAMGDRGFHFHHLRHGAASWLLIGLLANDLDLARYAGRADWLQDVIKTAPRDKMLLTGNSGPTRKALTAVSLLLGHSSPKITLEHYIHCLDLLLHAECDTSHIDMRSAQIHGLLEVPLRNVQRWAAKGPEHAMAQLEKRFAAYFQRDERPLARQQHIEDVESDEPQLFQLLEAHWLRMHREQSIRLRDPGRIHRAPSQGMGVMIDALNHVQSIETDKRGNQAKTHRLKSFNEIALPPMLRGQSPRGTALTTSRMLHDAFMLDPERTRSAITVWGEHTGKVKGYFRLNADNGSMEWLLGSGCLKPSWYDWANKAFQRVWLSSEGSPSELPADAYYFRLSRPRNPDVEAPRTERQAIWWVLSMSYALVTGGVL